MLRLMVLAVRIHHTGGPEVLRVDRLDLADPGPGEVLVRHDAIGVNFIDTYHRSGLYPVSPLPAVLGLEAAGTVEAVGVEVREFSIGDRVAYASVPMGAYAEARLIPSHRLVHLPQAISTDAAAAAMLKGMTVQYLVRRTFPVVAGQTVLWHAAAGGVGLIACQWLRHLGVRVIGTVGSEAKAELARHHGCDHPIVYTREDFVGRVRELTQGRGVPVVYDSVGRSTMAGSLQCLAPRGLLVSFGNASGKPEPIDLGLLGAQGSAFMTRPSLMDYTKSREELVASATALFDVMANGAVAVQVSRRWPLSEAADAHRALEARRTTGSCLLVP
jgi:NADPH2:quinone reductase